MSAALQNKSKKSALKLHDAKCCIKTAVYNLKRQHHSFAASGGVSSSIGAMGKDVKHAHLAPHRASGLVRSAVIELPWSAASGFFYAENRKFWAAILANAGKQPLVEVTCKRRHFRESAARFDSASPGPICYMAEGQEGQLKRQDTLRRFDGWIVRILLCKPEYEYSRETDTVRTPSIEAGRHVFELLGPPFTKHCIKPVASGQEVASFSTPG